MDGFTAKHFSVSKIEEWRKDKIKKTRRSFPKRVGRRCNQLLRTTGAFHLIIIVFIEPTDWKSAKNWNGKTEAQRSDELGERCRRWDGTFTIVTISSSSGPTIINSLIYEPKAAGFFFWAFTGRRWMPPTVFSVPQARETDEITEVFFLLSSYHSERLWHTQQVISPAESRSSSSNKHHTKGSVWWIMLIYYNLMFINNNFNYSRAFLRALERSLGAVPRLMNIFNSMKTWNLISHLTNGSRNRLRKRLFFSSSSELCVFFGVPLEKMKFVHASFVDIRGSSKLFELRVGNFFSPLFVSPTISTLDSLHNSEKNANRNGNTHELIIHNK